METHVIGVHAVIVHAGSVIEYPVTRPRAFYTLRVP